MVQYITRRELERLLKTMAILDIVMISKEKSRLRVVKFSKKEDASIYTIENGAGDNLLVIFTEKGVLLKGFDHENDLNQFAADEWDHSFFEHVFAGLPNEFEMILDEDDRDYTTFCMWCLDATDTWMQNEIDNNDGGKDFLLSYICKTPDEWGEWAKYYYEAKFEQEVVKKIYKGETLTEEDAVKLNPKCNVTEVLDEIRESFPN